MKQVTMKTTIMKIIDDHLCSSLSSIPSKRNVAMDPAPIANAIRNQKSMSVRFLVIHFCSSDTTGSIGGISDVSEDFVDPNKDPRSYIKRYILEEKYRDWFDRNYPDNTIYNAVGLNEWDYNEFKKKLSPDQTGDDVKTEPETEP